MKVFVALFALMAVAAAAPQGSDHVLHAILQAKWGAFKATHGKEYHPEEEHKRLSNFLQKTHMIETHNERFAKGLESFQVGHNELSDLSFEEYLNTRLGAVPPTEPEACNATYFQPSAGFRAPQSVNWVEKGHVKHVKNQGSCGSCYAFASAAALEAQHARKHGGAVDLSEQQLVDCTVNMGNGGCSGGWMHTCFKHVQDQGGINTQRNYPYESKAGACRYKAHDPACKVTSHVRIPYGDERALQEAVASVGPVTIAYDASTREFGSYQSGIYQSANCQPQRTSHAVLVVGYGTEGGVDYWLCKNSWGASWGLKGYFKMARNKNNHCGVCTAASYPVVA